MAIRIATIVSFRTFEKWKQGIWESDLSTASIGGLARANSFKQPSARKQKVKPVEAAAVEFIRARRIALIELVLGRKLLFEHSNVHMTLCPMVLSDRTPGPHWTPRDRSGCGLHNYLPTNGFFVPDRTRRHC